MQAASDASPNDVPSPDLSRASTAHDIAETEVAPLPDDTPSEESAVRVDVESPTPVDRLDQTVPVHVEEDGPIDEASATTVDQTSSAPPDDIASNSSSSRASVFEDSAEYERNANFFDAEGGSTSQFSESSANKSESVASGDTQVVHPLASDTLADEIGDDDGLPLPSPVAVAARSVAGRALLDAGASQKVSSIYDTAEEAPSAAAESVGTSTATRKEVYVPPSRPAAVRAEQATADRLIDSWQQWPSASRQNLIDVSCSKYHVWVIDSKDNVFVSLLSQPKWQAVRGRMRHISVSPSGEVVWGRSKSGSMYYRAGISRSYPIGTDWKKMDYKVKTFAADNRRCWVIDQRDQLRLRRTVSPGVCICQCMRVPNWFSVICSQLAYQSMQLIRLSLPCLLVPSSFPGHSHSP